MVKDNSYFPNAPESMGKKYYVAQNAPNASDDNAGTEELPFKTISKAASVVDVSDEVIIEEGTYREEVPIIRHGHKYYIIEIVWSLAEQTSIWGFPANLLALRDGGILCAYGYRRLPYGLKACLSYDEGNTWDLKNEILLRSDGSHYDLGYPSSVELEDNQIFTVYYFHTGKSIYGHLDYFWRLAGVRYIAGIFYKV